MAGYHDIERSAALGRWLRRRAENVAVALLSMMFACFIIQIFFRYVLNNPVGWTEEVIITTWLWTVLWGAAFILSEAEEIRFDIIYSNISESARRASSRSSPASRWFCSTASRCRRPTTT